MIRTNRLAVACVLLLLLNVIQAVYINKLQARNPVIIYQTDSAGGMTAVGVVTEKKEDGGVYSIAVNGYGWFHVDKEHYDMIEVGRKAPRFILDRGS